MDDHRIDWRPHAYELLALANVLAIFLVTARRTMQVLLTIPALFAIIGQSLLLQLLAGVAVRLVIGAIRGNWREYLAIIRRPAWFVETVRLLVGAALVVHAYCWIKVTVPLLHPVLYDQQLWDLDQRLCFGVSPNLFMLNVFSHPLALHVFDATYANIFIASMTVAFAYFLSAPANRLRIAFLTGNALLWLAGAWLYMAIPSIGPAYRFPEVWLQYANDFRVTEALQVRLWLNYNKVLQMRRPGGAAAPIDILLGIAAFPSMHVAFQTFVFLWFRRLWTWGELLFALFVAVIFIGSMVTGWHYLIDAIAGVLLAWITYEIANRLYRVKRWAALSG
jgi:PAP2 superfamily